VQLIAWEDHSQNDLLCVERDVKQVAQQLNTAAEAVAKFLVYLAAFGALTLLVGRREDHPTCKNSSDEVGARVVICLQRGANEARRPSCRPTDSIKALEVTRKLCKGADGYHGTEGR